MITIEHTRDHGMVNSTTIHWPTPLSFEQERDLMTIFAALLAFRSEPTPVNSRKLTDAIWDE